MALDFDESAYLVLALRYKELSKPGGDGGDEDVPYDIHSYLTEIDTGRIDTAYMNANFDKWLKRLANGADPADLDTMLDELHGSFAMLDQEQQRYAEMVIQAAQGFDLAIEAGKSFMDYINDFQAKGKSGQVKAVANALGIDEGKLRALMARHVTEKNINEYGRFESLKETADTKLVREFFSQREGKTVSAFEASRMLDRLLREFVLTGGFDLN